jgi:hypothetical protein
MKSEEYETAPRMSAVYCVSGLAIRASLDVGPFRKIDPYAGRWHKAESAGSSWDARERQLRRKVQQQTHLGRRTGTRGILACSVR